MSKTNYLSVFFTALFAIASYAENTPVLDQVSIRFSGSTATVKNGAGTGVTVQQNNAHISITSGKADVEYVVSGCSENGSLNISSDHPFQLTLNGVELTTADGPALHFSESAPARINLATDTTSTLSDSKAGQNKIKALLYSDGPLIFSGTGSLLLNSRGEKQHAICTKEDITVESGTIQIANAVRDGIHAAGSFRMNGGKLAIAATGDGIDANGQVELHGGALRVSSKSADTQAIKCKGNVLVQGGNTEISVEGSQSQGIKSGGNIEIDGGTVTMRLSGAVALEAVTDGTIAYTDPEYCKAVNCGGNLVVRGGTLDVQHSGTAGKAICVEGDARMDGGSINLKVTGGCTESFTDKDGEPAIASSDAFKIDGNVAILGGELTILNTGNAGDGMTAGGSILIGETGTEGPSMNIFR